MPRTAIWRRRKGDAATAQRAIALSARDALHMATYRRSTAAAPEPQGKLFVCVNCAKETTVRSLLFSLGLVVSSLGAVSVAAQSPADGAAFILRVDSEGSFFLTDATAPADDASVVAQAADALNRDANAALVIEGDAAAPYESVERAARLLQEAGASRISFRTSNTAPAPSVGPN